MAGIGEASVLPKPIPTDDKPVVVRVKRKAFQSCLDAFWLEINERPVKRVLLDFDNLCIADSLSSSAAAAKEEAKTKKVLLQHVETISSSESIIETVLSFVPNNADVLASKAKIDERKNTFKKENKQDQLLSKAMQKQKALAENARFEQVWRSRKGNEEALVYKSLHEKCRFYDIVRVDVEENSSKAQQQEDMSLEDQRLLCSYLPLLRDLIPNAAAEIESDMMNSYISKQASSDDYVYDVYTVTDDTVMNDEESLNPFPLVQVDDEEFYDGPDDSDNESDDSNAENNPLNDYPDEIDEEEEEEDAVESSSDESEELEKSSDKSDEAEDDEDKDTKYEDEMDDDFFDSIDDDESGKCSRDFDFSDMQEWRQANP